VAEGVPHLTAKNVKQGRLKTDGCTFVTEEGFNQTRRRYEPRAGDVIVTCVGTIGETAVVPEGLTFSADRNLAAIRLADGHEPSYVRLALSSPLSRRVMGAASGSTAQPHLYLRDLRALSVPVPPPDEQRRIAAEIERSMSVINAVRGVIDVAQRRSNSLRRSILERAFCGELVPQDPTDEPASILLERIHAEQPVASGRRRVSA
jgi:type I restriction enzyme S subunit